MTLRLGSMFSGYGGLDISISQILDTETVFVADVCKVDKDGMVGHHEPHRSPCSILSHRFPGVPNLGDVSLIDWTDWAGNVDLLCAGFPCQDVSHAGKRAGMKEGTRTVLWSQVVRAIRELNPRMVFLENVPGIFTAPAAGDVEPCPWCVGEPAGEHLRALDAVLADLAELGFDAEWTTLRASDVGAAHQRNRWFLVAYPRSEHGLERWLAASREAASGGAFGESAGRDRAPGAAVRPSIDGIVKLLPTPSAQAPDAKLSDRARNVYGSTDRLGDVVDKQTWGQYAEAIARHERAFGRRAPAPTEPGRNDKPRLSPRFTEWLIGLADGWITDVPGMTRNEALKACGNGVVPRQAATAYAHLLDRLTASANAGAVLFEEPA